MEITGYPPYKRFLHNTCVVSFDPSLKPLLVYLLQIYGVIPVLSHSGPAEFEQLERALPDINYFPSGITFFIYQSMLDGLSGYMGTNI
ncbi:hypothetical protein ACTXT7_009005 [Hymenolepis weldensis]